MKLLIATEKRFFRDVSGVLKTEISQDKHFWSRYLDEFDEVNILARVKRVNSFLDKYVPVEDVKIKVIDLPYYVGPWQFILKFPRILVACYKIIKNKNYIIILRIPGLISSCLWFILRISDIKYGVEVIGYPDTRTLNKAFLDKIYYKLISWLMKYECNYAIAAAYVTRETIQRAYPAKRAKYCTNYSSVELDDSYFVNNRRYESPLKKINAVTIGSLEQKHKRIENIIEAAYMCKRDGLEIELHIVGGGRYLKKYKELSEEKGVKTIIYGFVEKQKVKEILFQSDIYIHSSQSEGLPRGLIEAMATGLVCIATNVGGVPELLGKEYTFNVGDSFGLYKKIIKLVKDPQMLKEAGSKNRLVAMNYHSSILRERRRMFYKELKKLYFENSIK